MNICYTTLLYVSVPLLSIRGRIASGDWSRLFCCMNAIATVFVINDVKNLPAQDLHRLFTAIQDKKEANRHNELNKAVVKPNFSVIIETLEPMSYEEGKIEIVDYYRMFTVEQ